VFKGATMDSQFLPKSIDNNYRGHKLAFWFIGVVVIMRAAQGFSLIFNGYSIVREADGIPLETYPIAAAQTVVAMFLVSGLSRIILSLLCVLALVRYRSAITLMVVVLAIDQVGRQLIFHFYPLVRVGNPLGPTVNYILLVLTIIGLVLSLWGKRNYQEKN
jgi:hypothetical protein